MRAGSFGEEGAALHEGRELRLVPGTGHSTAEVVTVDYDRLLSDVQVGDSLSVGDGQVVLRVEERLPDGLSAVVLHGGLIKGRPGLHIPADHLTLTTPTDEDLRLLDAFVDVGADMVALSFVRSAHDVRKIGTEPHPRGPLVVAKIETRAAVDNLAGIVEASGAIMVARGDLGAECRLEDLPHLQKDIIRQCIALGRPVITATQMLESMVESPTPTRAEASDVANAVFDGSSVVMLSAETAVGRDPTNVVRTMARIAERADERFDYAGWAQGLTSLSMTSADDEHAAITDAMTSAAWRASVEVRPTAILCLTRTGFTVRSIARFRPDMPILGFSEDERTVNQLTMSWGATPIQFERGASWESDIRRAAELARRRGEVRSGDVVGVLVGSDQAHVELTDTLRLMRVP
ncbi:MAG: pyruvate kinase [Acidimicrobiia bacterium]|nr:pyruvate kinase [Acidimicrobiia bacterium]